MRKAMAVLTACVIVALVIFSAHYAVDSTAKALEKDFKDNTSQSFIQDKRPETWEKYLFPQDEVIEIRITIDEDQYDYMVDHAAQELYVPANMVYNSIKINNIGIRPKGNSSLRTAIQAGDGQFSFRLELDEYLNQSLYGISAINLNNCMSDPSYIREIMSYEIIEEIGLPAPERVFCNLFINDELIGLYLAVQQIDEVFTSAWFRDGTGDLYKPEGTGANLVYLDDDYNSYTGLGERTPVDTQGRQDVVAMIKALNTGENLEEVLYTDLILKYHAINTALLSLDSYMGGMFHNYYLYGEDGKYMVIPWDYNMSFGGFGTGSAPVSSSDTQFYIDEPTAGTLSNYPLVNALLTQEDYLETYHDYLHELLNGPLELGRFTKRAQELTAMIDPYVKNDPNPMNSYASFQSALYDSTDTSLTAISFEIPSAHRSMGTGKPLITFVQDWTANMSKQLSGELASKNGGEGNQAGMRVGGMPPDGQFQGKMEAMNGQEMQAFRQEMMNEPGQRPPGFDERRQMGERFMGIGANASETMMANPMQPPEPMQMDPFQGGEQTHPPQEMGDFPQAFQKEASRTSHPYQASLMSIMGGKNPLQYMSVIILAVFVIAFAWAIKKKA